MNSLSSRFVKMTALEGTFSPVQNMVSFSIPAGMKLDLSECSVIVDLGITTTTTNAPSAPPTGQFGSEPSGGSIYNIAVLPDDAGQTNTVLPNVYYVKNADIRCERVGAIESLRAVNTLRLALDIYENDLETKQGEQYLGGGNSDAIGGMNGSPFRDLVRQGTILSRNRSAQLRIPLRHIFDVAHTPVWDTSKYGRTDVRLEMAFDKLSTKQTMGQTDANWTNADFGVYGALDPANAGSAAPAGGLLVKDFATTKTYTHPEEETPFYTGQRLIIQYTITATGGAATVFSIANGNARERTLTGISYNNTHTKKLTIAFDDAIPMAVGDVMSAVTCVGVDAATKTIIYNKVELEMKQVSAPTPASVEYTTYNTEEDSGFSATQININKQYTCEGQADTLVVCAMGSNGGVQRMNPTTKINSSRITINNKEETPEAVVGRNRETNNVAQANPLYYDRVDRTFFNMGDDLECLNERQLGFNFGLQNNPTTTIASALLNPLPVMAMSKQVQLDLDYTAGEITQLNLYKRIVKQI